MEIGKEICDGEPQKAFSYADGKLRFSKKTERNIFFILTLIMLSWGALLKLSDFIG